MRHIIETFRKPSLTEKQYVENASLNQITARLMLVHSEPLNIQISNRDRIHGSSIIPTVGNTTKGQQYKREKKHTFQQQFNKMSKFAILRTETKSAFPDSRE